VYDKTWCIGIVQDVNPEHVDASIHPDVFISFILATKRLFLLDTNAAPYLHYG